MAELKGTKRGPARALTDSEYVWKMILEMDKLPNPAPEIALHRERLQRIAWKLSAVDYFEARLKSGKRKRRDSSAG